MKCSKLLLITLLTSTAAVIVNSQHHYDHFHHISSGAGYLPRLNYPSPFMPWGTSGWYTVATAKPFTTASPPVIKATNKRLTNNNNSNNNNIIHDNSENTSLNNNKSRSKVKAQLTRADEASSDSTDSSNNYFDTGHGPKLIDSVFAGTFYKNPYSQCNCDAKNDKSPPTTQASADQDDETTDQAKTNQQEGNDGDDNRPAETYSVNDFDDEQIESEQSSQDVTKRRKSSNSKKSRLQRATAKILQSTNPSSLEFLCEQFIQVNDLTFNHTLGRFTASTAGKLRKNGKVKGKKVSKATSSSSSSGKISKNGKTRQVKLSNQLDKTLQLVEREASSSGSPYTSPFQQQQFLTTTTKLPLASRKSRNPSPLIQPYRVSLAATWGGDNYEKQSTAPDEEEDEREQDADDTDDTTEGTTRAPRSSTTQSDRVVDDEWNQQREVGQVKGGRSRTRTPSAAVKGRNGQAKKPLRERD